MCYVCLYVSHFTPRRGSRTPGLADLGPKVLIRYYYNSYGAIFLCWRLSFRGRRQKPYLLEGRGGQVCWGMHNADFSEGQKLHTPLPTGKSTRERKHHYTTLTNASTSLRRQGEHNRTQSQRGLLTLTPTHATGWQRRRNPEPYWLSCEIPREHSAARQLWPARDTLARFPDRAWSEGVPCAQRVVRVVHEEVVL